MENIADKQQRLCTIGTRTAKEQSVLIRSVVQRHCQRVAVQRPPLQNNDGTQEQDDENDSVEKELEHTGTSVTLSCCTFIYYLKYIFILYFEKIL